MDDGIVTSVPDDIVSCCVEGVNEARMQGGGFFFQPYSKARLQDPDPAHFDKTIVGWKVGFYLLSKVKTIEDFKRLLPEVRVVGAPLLPPNPGRNFEPMIQYAFNDEAGAAVVVEYLDGELRIFGNPFGTLTNAPDFPWHQENLNQFTAPLLDQPAPFGDDVVAHGASGLDIGAKLNLPGEMTSQNRFAQAALFSQHAVPFKDAQGGVERVTNPLHYFDTPLGDKLYKHTDGKE